MASHLKFDGCAIYKVTIFITKMGRKHILYFSLPTRIARLVLSGLALFAQEFVNVALRWHGAFLDSSRNIHYLLLVLLLVLLLMLLRQRQLVRLLRLVMRHGSMMVVAVHAWLLVLLWRGLVLDFRRVRIVQRRIQEIVAAHGGDGAGKSALFRLLMDAMVQCSSGDTDVDVA